jgi:hypothetical protein
MTCDVSGIKAQSVAAVDGRRRVLRRCSRSGCHHTTPLFPLNFLDISAVCFTFAASIHSSFALAARCGSSEEPSRRRQEHAGDLVIGRSTLSATAVVSGI